VLSGEAFDLVIVTQAGLRQGVAAGKIDAGTCQPVVQAGVGGAVKLVAPVPGIGSVAEYLIADWHDDRNDKLQPVDPAPPRRRARPLKGRCASC
jgi:hypothetical protein